MIKALLILLTLGLAGCATTRTRGPEAAGGSPAQPGGEIVRVNAAAGYVVAECSVLPSAGEEATVIRGNQAAGRIRFTGQVRPPYAVADILAGRPLAGDRWRQPGPVEATPPEQ